MGDPEQCPIVPNEVIRATVNGGRVLSYAVWVDVIHTFPNEQYDHVKYWNDEAGTFEYHFFSEDVLSALAANGLPIIERKSITQKEHDAWAEYEAAVESYDLQDEIERFFGGL